MLLKAVVLAGCIGGIVEVVKRFPSSRFKRACKAGGLYLKKDKKILYPKILKASDERIVCRLLDGMKADDFIKNEYVFKQVFGEYSEIEIVGVNTVILNIYNQKMQMYDYSFEELKLKEQLPMYLGKRRSGEFEVYDMKEFPHLLITGATGYGKSTLLRTLIVTLRLHLGKVGVFYLNDLKRSEFGIFRGLDGFHVAVEPDDVADNLGSVLWLMQERGRYLDENGLQEWEGEPVFFIVDEFTLLGKTELEGINRIGAVGRALGVFLIVSMQRPDAKVLDGALKNNLTVRVSFRQSNEVSSRVALDTDLASRIEKGAKGLLVTSESVQVQVPWLSGSEAKRLLEVGRSVGSAVGAGAVRRGILHDRGPVNRKRSEDSELFEYLEGFES